MKQKSAVQKYFERSFKPSQGPVRKKMFFANVTGSTLHILSFETGVGIKKRKVQIRNCHSLVPLPDFVPYLVEKIELHPRTVLFPIHTAVEVPRIVNIRVLFKALYQQGIHSAMWKKEIFQSCDTQCTKVDCDIDLKLIIPYFNA